MLRYNVLDANGSRLRTSIEEPHLAPQETLAVRESRVRMADEHIVIWDDGQGDRRWSGRWQGPWVEPVQADPEVLALLGGLLLYGGYERWMAGITRIIAREQIEGRRWGMGSMGRGASSIERISVIVTTIEDSGALLDQEREFYLASHAQGDDLSMQTADRIEDVHA